MGYISLIVVLMVLVVASGFAIHLYRQRYTMYDKTDMLRIVSICGLILAILVFLLLFQVIRNYGKGMEVKNEIEIEDLPDSWQQMSESLLESVETEASSVEDTTLSKKPEYTEVITYNVEEYLKNDVQNIKNGNKKTIGRWFGDSKIFTSENMQKALSGVEISISKNNKIHICVFNEKKVGELREKYLREEREMNVNIDEDSIQAYIDMRIKKEVEDKSIYDCYELNVTVTDGNVDITEDLKEILTGGWYTGIGTDIEQHRVQHSSESTNESLDGANNSTNNIGNKDTAETLQESIAKSTEFDINDYKINWDELEKVPEVK